MLYPLTHWSKKRQLCGQLGMKVRNGMLYESLQNSQYFKTLCKGLVLLHISYLFCRAPLSRCSLQSLHNFLSFTQLLLQAAPDLSPHSITSTRADLATWANLHTSKSLQFCCSPPRFCSVITWLLTAFPTCLACQSRKIHSHYSKTKRTNLIPCWNPICTTQCLG